MQRIKKICISFCVVAILFMIGVVTEPRFRSADIMNPDVVGFITTAPLPETLQDITKDVSEDGNETDIDEMSMSEEILDELQDDEYIIVR